jgi:Carboxypeptidase regulatory-like domain/TonB dependent receptor-like, beta-barrel
MVRHTTPKAFAHVLLFLLAVLPAAALAQSPTGTISGQVTDPQGRVVAGVTVTATSPNLQGEAKTTTTPNGDYIFKLLPPGVYTLSFEKSGFAIGTETRTVAAVELVALDMMLKPATVRENVTVTADAGEFVRSISEATSIKADLLGSLPSSRTMLSAVNLAPAAHATGPGGSVSIDGAVSFENVYLLNGVEIQDNLRGDPFNLFIEDAIQETTISTSGVSAEYGRFSGGIVNTLTKSGGNLFSGSFRESLSNDNWRSVSPFGEPKKNDTVPTSEFTVGGPVVKDRTWFFAAGRVQDSQVARQTGYTKTPYTFEQNEKRFEGKVTQTLGIGQRLEVGYTGISRQQQNSAWPSSSAVMDLASLTNPNLPESLVQVHYTGTFGSKLFLEGQYSARTFTFKQSGGLQTDLISGTPLMDQTTGAWWWAPNFCGVCTDEKRDNDSLVLKGSYFVSNRHGSHDIVFGYDGFNDKMRVDNHQSASDYHVWATGSEIVDGTVYPIIEPGFSTWIIHWPITESSHGTNFRTHALFVNDSWTVNRQLSFNLGLRYDKNSGRDASDVLVAKDSMLSPRAGVAWHPAGDERTTIRATAGRYVAAINNGIAGTTAPAGTPSILAYFYDGPGINDGDGPLVPTDAALQQLFNWYDAAQPDPFFVDIPGVSSRINGSLKSPHANEFTVGISRELSTRASVRVDVVNRKYADFYSERIDTTTGVVFDEFGQPYDLALYENTNDLKRQYRGLDVQGTYRPSDSLNVGGTYTLSRLWGNFDGETSNNGPVPADRQIYPEYTASSWGYPVGDLSSDQRHRARLWAVYDLPWGDRMGAMSLGVLQQVESGTPYGAVGTVVVSPFVADAGYVTPPDTVTYYFTPRDAYRTATMYRTDVSFNISRRLQSRGGPEIFAQFQVLNVFNKFQAFDNTDVNLINTTVLTAVDDPSYDVFNPFTDTPVEGVNWTKGSKFGTAVSADAYTTPRLFRCSFGVRF